MVGDDSRIHLMKEEKENESGRHATTRMEGDHTSDSLEISATTTQNQIIHICWYGKYCSEVVFCSISTVQNFERYRSFLIFVRRQFFNASANELCELFQRGAGSASHSTHIRKTKVRPMMGTSTVIRETVRHRSLFTDNT